jgi:pilus assembly protein Flp/PilA
MARYLLLRVVGEEVLPVVRSCRRSGDESRTGIVPGEKGGKMMLHRFFTMFQDEEGQGLVEYALIILLVAIAVIGLLTALGGNVGNTFSTISSSLSGS